MRVHRFTFGAAALIAVLAPGPVQAAGAGTLPAPVAAALRAAAVPLAGAALVVHEIGAARPLLAYNAGNPMNPASTMKLVTTLAALELLGPTFAWTTELWAAGAQQGDVLEGDLLLRGTGDPKLTVENFWLMLRALRARGLREIRGDLVLDRSYFDAVSQDAARFDNQPLRPYNVAPDAMLLNFKAFRFTFVPDPGRGWTQVTVEPRSTLLEVGNAVRLAEGPCNDWRAKLKADFNGNDGVDGKARAAFSGMFPASCGEKTWNVALQSHPNYVLGVFRQLWEELGGTLRGGVRDGAVPPAARLLYSNQSPALAEVVRDMNKFSNNVMARQLFLTLSAEMMRQPGRAERSAQVVQGWLARKGLEFPELIMENGSGLSRAERISAENMGRLLLAAYASPVMPEFIASMPLVAYDGTMRRRLKYESVAGQAHIKTGSLSDVRSLAGYVLDARGRRFAVVFIVNHPNAGATQSAQDALLSWVYAGAGH
ncbi:MAG: D-alanyl-D-alanine carboxypeptidase/D-alanyl-D-alanine-endopeptidase [Betaproteobacteria bacterium RIFCSPLOWO2_02_FULL_65_24]|nr:MAG: D-alanyl-D-alanine carboxypeptidase/D-alanyl-D-alanine-endopeptidase [Betaproteobacteria bacterium RIFCSPLOWO2_02_FULL_65_24]OGA93197.1 MAG: D-alanyl-D-alanine carboxypeptidase/D-alanyl-D-alanine-endopeptidase [Betaproteobacteria bacterium RIFCSPLOWO2_12_FULL_66_14]